MNEPMTNNEIAEAMRHHCLSDKPALLVEPIKWWKHQKFIINPIKNPVKWYKYWFRKLPNRNCTNFRCWWIGKKVAFFINRDIRLMRIPKSHPMLEKAIDGMLDNWSEDQNKHD